MRAQTEEGTGEAVLGITRNKRGLTIGLPPEPPGGGSPVQIMALNNGQPLVVDVRNELRQRQEWDVMVTWGEGRRAKGMGQREVMLTFDRVGYAPKDVSLYLVDMATGRRIYLRTQHSYRFVPSDGETFRKFKVIAEFGNEKPLRIVGLKATPMRGQGVVISFALTKPAQVQAEVMTLTGQSVAILEAGQSRGVGEQLLVWRGVGNDGMKIPVGIYLVRVVAVDDEGRQVQATTMMRVIK